MRRWWLPRRNGPHAQRERALGRGITGAPCFRPCSPEAACAAASFTAGQTKTLLIQPTSPSGPEDLAATIFTSLGIDPELRVADAQGRPVPLVDGGTPLTEIFG